MITPKRGESGSVRKGHFFHIEVRPSTEFEAFYTEDVGRKGHSKLVLGKSKEDGKWITHKWLISKEDAYISDHGKVESEDPRIQKILDYLDGDLTHKEKDTFSARPHRRLKDFEVEKSRHSPQECPEMYFESYDDYEKYQEQMMNKSTFLG